MAGADMEGAIAETRTLLGLNGEKTVEQIKNELKTIKACTAKDELATLFGVTAEEVTPEKCTEEYNNLLATSKLEDFVYSTVQYAVWYANGGVDSNGNAIGNTLEGSGELNKLYQYE